MQTKGGGNAVMRFEFAAFRGDASPAQAGAPFAKTHDLEKIGALAAQAWPQWTPLFAATGTWTVWGVAYRYPELEETPEPDTATLRQALQIIVDLEAALRTLAASIPTE